jgi:hypothetical protein
MQTHPARSIYHDERYGRRTQRACRRGAAVFLIWMGNVETAREDGVFGLRPFFNGDGFEEGFIPDKWRRLRLKNSELHQWVIGSDNGTVGWDRTSDLRIHNPAL